MTEHTQTQQIEIEIPEVTELLEIFRQVQENQGVQTELFQQLLEDNKELKGIVAKLESALKVSDLKEMVATLRDEVLLPQKELVQKFVYGELEPQNEAFVLGQCDVLKGMITNLEERKTELIGNIAFTEKELRNAKRQHKDSEDDSLSLEKIHEIGILKTSIRLYKEQLSFHNTMLTTYKKQLDDLSRVDVTFVPVNPHLHDLPVSYQDPRGGLPCEEEEENSEKVGSKFFNVISSKVLWSVILLGVILFMLYYLDKIS